ncbi:MAG TPA: L,D-transpeptidase family protein [Deltaproteobacteria bacterium]|jgi:L,D-transpeptidase ErfK/SrfK|nr:L,D-transpeptidase family protein [Deltaproteobacteria bacterium]HOI06217.1 L,D-transpeptidase family protein [Deltaproteobacteria bacterium]
MNRAIELTPASGKLLLVAACAAVLLLQGCATAKQAQEKPSSYPLYPESRLERNTFPIVGGSDVIGRLAFVRVEEGDTLPDIARHFSLGVSQISAANPGVDVWVPQDGERVMLPLRFVLPDAPRRGIVINLASMRLFQYRKNGKSLVVTTYPVGVGTSERPTPTGQMHVARKVVRPTWYVPASIAGDYRKKGDPLPETVPPGPDNPLGEHALYLSKPTYLIHGTNKPASIGLEATNGCLRLYPEDAKRLFESTPVNTPVCIVNQPYLVGMRNGIVYLEVHAPPEAPDTAELEKARVKLRKLEKKSGRALDWKRVEQALAEARGIPVPIFEFLPDRWVEPTVEVEHPVALYGKPKVPELKLKAWYVWAADLDDETEAKRMAAIINHQGPPIPARVLRKGRGFRVVTGPFEDAGEARKAVRRLKFDLEIDGAVIGPDGEGS